MARLASILTALAAVLQVSCSSGSPTAPQPTPGSPPEVRVVEWSGADFSASHTPNNAPNARAKTRPRAIPGSPYPVIGGRAPLTVHFNLCESSDPDQSVADDDPMAGEGDSLNWQFHFGDDGTEPFAADGSFNPNFEHFCRVDHTYAEGSYVATLSVTDKHLEDQSGGVSAFARETIRFTVVAGGDPPPDPIFTFTGSVSVNILVGPEIAYATGFGSGTAYTVGGVLTPISVTGPIAVCAGTSSAFGSMSLVAFTTATDVNGLTYFVAASGSTVGAVDLTGCRIYT